MYELLDGMRIVEAASFIAAPSAGLYLSQMGAEVIRVDPIGGGPDFARWPRSANGASFYWEGLNKGKKSVAVELGSAEGRELLLQLATAAGANAGILLSNYPVDGFLAHKHLQARRADMISVRIMGQRNGAAALDYTVNCAIGIPGITGPATLADEPVNHVLPAWDLMSGAYAAFATLAAERHRRRGGQGQEVRIPLSDIAITSVANMGQIAEVLQAGANRERFGNDVYGAFGRDFLTADAQRIMIVALTPHQWSGLLQALAIGDEVAAIERERGVSFARDEGLRFEHRDALVPLVSARVAARSLGELAREFERLGVCWGPYQGLREAADDPALVRANPVFSNIDNPSGMRYPAPGAAATLPGMQRHAPRPAPRLGSHTEEVLASVLGMSSGEIARLFDKAIIAAC